jgi:hypothetical protein
MRVVCVSNNDGIPVKYNGEVVGMAYIKQDRTMMVVLDTKEDEIKSMLHGTQQSISVEIARNNT